MRIGIVLAAGDATRMPNKALLPLRGNRLVITSGIDMLLRSRCDTVIVVAKSDEPLRSILEAQGYGRIRFCAQQMPKGVPDAVSAAYDPNAENLITFCDNVFSPWEFVPTDIRPNLAAVRNVPGDAAKQLATWSPEYGWGGPGKLRPCLAGWYLLRGNLDWAHESSTDFLNANEVRPFHVHDDYEWWDVGTVETYSEYWSKD